MDEDPVRQNDRMQVMRTPEPEVNSKCIDDAAKKDTYDLWIHVRWVM